MNMLKCSMWAMMVGLTACGGGGGGSGVAGSQPDTGLSALNAVPEAYRAQVRQAKAAADGVVRLAAWRANRDGAKAGALMDKLAQVAQGKDNIMPVMIECVEGGVTVGEVGAVLRRAFGEYQPPTVI